MGVHDRDWHKKNTNQRPQNPDWQKEYNRWYGRPNTPRPKQKKPWLPSLIGWTTVFIVVYICVEWLAPQLSHTVTRWPTSAPGQSHTEPPTTTEQPPQQIEQPRRAAPEITLYKCESASGQTIYKDTPCAQTTATTATNIPIPTPQPQHTIEDSGTATRRADEALARQWDARVAQRDQDIATEQAAMQNQVSVINAQCNQLRAQRDSILRLPIPYQQSPGYRNQMDALRARMSQLHC